MLTALEWSVKTSKPNEG